VAWAYLKEELTNTKESTAVNFLKERFPNLIRFTQFMDSYIEGGVTERLTWNTSDDFSLKLVNSL